METETNYQNPLHTNLTKDWLQHTSIKFLEKRKVAYIVSGALIILSIASLTFRGLSYGIDFRGGRTYVVRLAQDVQVADVQSALTASFGEMPEVKTFGSDNQIRITTTYKIEDDSENVDTEVEQLLMQGLKDANVLDDNVSLEEFTTDYQLSSQKVGPTISDDIRKFGYCNQFCSDYYLPVYTYKVYQLAIGLGAVAAIAHDALIVLGIFSLLYNVLPFSLDIDQAFIAAILTVIGYSGLMILWLFDRIREYLKIHPKRKQEQNMDEAVNSTLRRTFSTSLSTFVVLFAIFLFGGATIRGFTFALMVGVVVGTYSSIFVATPIAYDFQRRLKKAVSINKTQKN
jgi:SecD/SecF fusion protein